MSERGAGRSERGAGRSERGAGGLNAGRGGLNAGRAGGVAGELTRDAVRWARDDDSASMLGSLAAVIMTPDDATGSASEAEDMDYGIGAEYQAIHAPVRRAGLHVFPGWVGPMSADSGGSFESRISAQLSMAIQAEQDPLETVSDPKGFAGRMLAQFAATNGAAVTSCASTRVCLSSWATELTTMAVPLCTYPTVPSARRPASAHRCRNPASTHGACAHFVDLAPHMCALLL